MKDGWSKQVRSGKHKPMECKKVAHRQKSIEELLIKNIVHLVCFSITHSLQTMTECPLVDNQITRQKFTSNNNNNASAAGCLPGNEETHFNPML